MTRRRVHSKQQYLQVSIYYPEVRPFGVDPLDSVRIVLDRQFSVVNFAPLKPLSYQPTDCPTRIYPHCHLCHH